jgi:hypothetical protein
MQKTTCKDMTTMSEKTISLSKLLLPVCELKQQYFVLFVKLRLKGLSHQTGNARKCFINKNPCFSRNLIFKTLSLILMGL